MGTKLLFQCIEAVDGRKYYVEPEAYYLIDESPRYYFSVYYKDGRVEITKEQFDNAMQAKLEYLMEAK